MPLDKAILDELGRKRYEEHRQAERDKRRDYLFSALQCVAWMIAGLACLGWSFHTTDVGYGRIAYWAGIAIGNGGILYTLAAAYRRGEQRGDW